MDCDTFSRCSPPVQYITCDFHLSTATVLQHIRNARVGGSAVDVQVLRPCERHRFRRPPPRTDSFDGRVRDIRARIVLGFRPALAARSSYSTDSCT